MRTVRAFLPASLAVLTLLIAVSPAFAQARPVAPPAPAPDTIDYSIGIGALGGFTRSTIKSDAETNALLMSRTGFMAGAWFGGNYDARIGFIGEVDYVTKGTKEREFGGELAFHYLEVPGLVRINLGSNTSTGASFYAVAGPVLSLRLKATLIDPEGDLDVTDGYERIDFGVMAGAGVQVHRVGIEVRGHWGLRNIEIEPAEGAPAVRHFSLQIVGKVRLN